MTDYTPETPQKTCTKCEQELLATDEFFRRKKNGKLVANCKKCDYKRSQEWAKKHPEKRKATEQKSREKNKEKRNAASREYHYAHREEINQRRSNYYFEHHEHELAKNEKYREENREREAQRSIEYYQNNRDVILARRRADRVANPEKYKIILTAEQRERARHSSRNSYLRNRDVILERTRKRHRNNPKLAVIAAERRLARFHSLPATLTREQWETALDYWGHKCAVCGRAADFWNVIAADHWIPLKSEGCPGTIHTNMLPLCHSRKDGEGGCNNSKSNRDPVEFVTTLLGKRKAKKKLAEIETFFQWIAGKFSE